MAPESRDLKWRLRAQTVWCHMPERAYMFGAMSLWENVIIEHEEIPIAMKARTGSLSFARIFGVNKIAFKNKTVLKMAIIRAFRDAISLDILSG